MAQISYTTSIDDLAGVADRITARLRIADRIRARLQVATWDVDDFAFILRWGVTLFGVIGGWIDSGDLGLRLRATVTIGVLAYAVLRSFVRLGSSRRQAFSVALAISDVTVYGSAAFFTGIWASPYVICVACSVALSGLVSGVLPAFAALTEIVAYHVIRVEVGAATLGSGPFAYKSIGIFAVGALGVCGGQLFSLQSQRVSEIRSLRSVNEVHSLLIELHARAADDPRSLTLNGTIEGTLAKVREEVEADVMAVLLRNPALSKSDQQWQVASAEGIHLPPMVSERQLPPIVRMADRQRSTLRWATLSGGEGVEHRSTSGLYAPLWGRSSLLGVMILERIGGSPFTDGDAGLVDRIGRHAGLAIENAHWFARLRHLGAEAERDRIARELHDRVGQSLAGVGLAVDRLAMTLPPEVHEAKGELASVAEDVRGVTRQIREKLTDLRTAPSPTAALGDVLGEFAERVGARSNLQVTFDYRPVRDLSAMEEHEVWRIAQEAILNAERHACARSLRVFWGEQFGWRLLIVSDDGKGIAGAASHRRDAYGLIGMRERAEVIGASLRIDTTPGRGTTVRLRLRDPKR